MCIGNSVRIFLVSLRLVCCLALGAMSAVMLLPNAALAQITTDPASSTSINAGTVTFAHSVGTGPNRLILVAVSIAEKDASVTSVTYGGQALTLLLAVRGPGGDGDIEIWSRIAPPSGTANVIVNLTKPRRFVVGAASFANVHQTATFGTAVSAQATSALASATVASATSELVFAGLVTNGDVVTATVGSGQTSLWTLKNGTGGSGVVGAGSTKPGAASTTMSWTLDRSDAWAAIAVPIKPTTPPLISLSLLSAPYSDPIRGTVNPLQFPGATVEMAATTQNSGSGSPDASSVVVVLAIPSSASLYVGSIGGVGSGPVLFADGTTPSALTYTFTSLSSTTDNLDFSNNNGTTWTYVPTPDALQVDANVTSIRVRPQGTFAPATTGTSPSFTLIYRAVVK